MDIKTSYEAHDIAALTALYLRDGMRVQAIVDDGTDCINMGEYKSVFDSHLPDVIDGNSEALLYVPDKDKELTYEDEDYNPQKIKVWRNLLYMFRMIDGKMIVTCYSGSELRRLLVDGV